MASIPAYIGYAMNQPTNQPEPWLRGTLTDTPGVQRAVLHAFQAAEEDLNRWCTSLTEEEIHQRPAGLASVGFHLRHIPGSIDRLLTYAEDRELSEEQLQAMKAEVGAVGSASECLQVLSDGLKAAADRVRKMNPADFDQPRYVGRKRMPTTVGGLLVHVADHTQRHVGQAITTARIILDKRGA
jgi:uncharacterized damage-inducible protein DinB